MNTLLAIAPYKFEGFWVFDDPSVGLRQEPFISGADRVLDILASDIPNAAQGFKLVFAAQPFSGFVARFVRGRSEFGGYWYSWPERGLEGWLCPALFKYFEGGARRDLRQSFPQAFDRWSRTLIDYACSSNHCVA